MCSQATIRLPLFLCFFHRRDRAAHDFQAYILGRHADVQRIIFQAHHRTTESAFGDDPVAGLEILEHLLFLLLPFLRGQNQQEVENGEDQREGQQLKQRVASLGLQQNERSGNDLDSLGTLLYQCGSTLVGKTLASRAGHAFIPRYPRRRCPASPDGLLVGNWRSPQLE